MAFYARQRHWPAPSNVVCEIVQRKKSAHASMIRRTSDAMRHDSDASERANALSGH